MKNLLLIIFVLTLAGCVEIQYPPPTVPEPPPAEKPVKMLTDYIWEDSDELVPGKAILMPHPTVVATSAKVRDEGLTYHSTYVNGRQVWYAENNVAFYGAANLEVETADAVYRTVAEVTEPSEPIPPTEPPEGVKIHGNVVGQANGNRTHCRFGAQFNGPGKLYFDGQLKLRIPNLAVRYEAPDGRLWKPISESNGLPVALGEYNRVYNSCYILK
jgi:hypothetical protein